jgi:hypothetical protein
MVKVTDREQRDPSDAGMARVERCSCGMGDKARGTAGGRLKILSPAASCWLTKVLMMQCWLEQSGTRPFAVVPPKRPPSRSSSKAGVQGHSRRDSKAEPSSSDALCSGPPTYKYTGESPFWSAKSLSWCSSSRPAPFGAQGWPLLSLLASFSAKNGLHLRGRKYLIPEASSLYLRPRQPTARA